MTSLVEQLVKVEFIYTYYAQDPDGESDGETYKEMLKNEYELLLSDYAEFCSDVENEANADEPDEKMLKALEDFNTYFGEMFNDYKAKCAAIDFTTNA